DGVVGYGEAAPLEPYDGVSVDRVERALERYRPVLAGPHEPRGAQLMDAPRRVEVPPRARGAVDLAVGYPGARREGKPVSALLSDDSASHVPVNATLWARAGAGVAGEAARAVREGYGCLKLKVGVGDGAGRVAAAGAGAGP